MNTINKFDENKWNFLSLSIMAINNASEILYEKSNINEKDNNININCLIIPAVVLKSFTCELYIKSILMYENVQIPEIHNLEKLFKRLHGKRQNTILNKTMELYTYHRKLVKSIKEDFISNLHQIANIFEFSRYLYEYLDVGENYICNMIFLDSFLSVLREVYVNIYNELLKE